MIKIDKREGCAPGMFVVTVNGEDFGPNESESVANEHIADLVERVEFMRDLGTDDTSIVWGLQHLKGLPGKWWIRG